MREKAMCKKCTLQMRIDQSSFIHLDVIISVGYCVKSKRGIEFRQWASKILKQYMIDGYSINEKRLYAMQKTVDIQTRMMAYIILLEENAQIKDEESIRRKHADVK